jgi:hypothetical protein
MKVDLSLIPEAFEVRTGLPRPNWSAIYDWVNDHVADADFDNAWTEVAREWLQKLHASLPPRYEISESDQFCLLSPQHNPPAEQLLGWCERFRDAVLKRLPGVAEDEGFGKHVVLAFDDESTYYDYVADYYPEDGAFATSGGIFLSDGYDHFAFWTRGCHQLDRTIAHELTHAMLCHLPLPLWLNEGVTQLLEDIVLDSSSFVIDRDLVQRHREYWSQDTIDGFWSGESFYLPSEGQPLSYHLALILVRNLCSDYQSKVLDFLRNAEFSDAGEAAALRILGDSLHDRVVQFLGPGNWKPRSEYGNADA